MTTDGPIDQPARDGVNRALAAIESHERVCTERWNEIRRLMDSVAAQNKEDVSAVRRGIEGLYAQITSIQQGQTAERGKMRGALSTLGAMGAAAAAIGAIVASFFGTIWHH